MTRVDERGAEGARASYLRVHVEKSALLRTNGGRRLRGVCVHEAERKQRARAAQARGAVVGARRPGKAEHRVLDLPRRADLDRARDKFIVMASDGVWEFLSSEDVAGIVNGFMEQGQDAIQAARFVIAKAAMAWRVEEGDYRDDITCIVLYLNDLPPSLAPKG